MDSDPSELLYELVRLNNRLEEIARRDFGVLSDAQLLWKPRPDAWSIAACLQHLNLIYQQWIPRLKENLEKHQETASSKPSFKPGLLGQYLVKSIQLKDNGGKLRHRKTAKHFRPEKNMDQDVRAILESFLKQSRALSKMIEGMAPYLFDRIRISMPHLSFIKLKLGDSLRYLVYHAERHIVQAQKVQSEDNFPKYSQYSV